MPIETWPRFTLENKLPRITPFEGKPIFRSSAIPSIAAQVRNGTLKRAENGLECLLYGVASRIALPDSYSRRIE